MKVERKSGRKLRVLSYSTYSAGRIRQEIRTDNTPSAGFTLAGITDQTNITVVNERLGSGYIYNCLRRHVVFHLTTTNNYANLCSYSYQVNYYFLRKYQILQARIKKILLTTDLSTISKTIDTSKEF